MSYSRDLIRNTLVRGLWLTVGRRNLVRLSRLLTMESRLDVGNDLDTNGERMVQERALSSVRQTPIVVFDVGANVGRWTSALLKTSNRDKRGAVQVYCFEPAAATYQSLCDRLVALKDRVIPIQAALSNVDGEAEFNIFGDGLGINSLHLPHQSRWNSEKQPVPTLEKVQLVTADSFCAREGIEQIALLKIDAEGHDLAVLEGARGMLEAHRIQVLQFEYNQRWIDSRHYLKDAFELLEPLGYKLGKITPRGIEFYPQWHFELETFREGNYLACLSEHVDLFPQIRWWNLPP